MTTAKPAHLTERFKTALNVPELKLKDISLDMLMTAFVDRLSSKGPDTSITLEVPALAKYYANKLASGQFVAFTDPNNGRDYFARAYGNDLVAFFYTYGPWYNCYTVIASSEHVLDALGITGPSTRDLALIDNFFGFSDEPEKEDKPLVTGTITTDADTTTPHWDWHQKHPIEEIIEEQQHSANQKEDHPQGKAERTVVVKPTVRVLKPTGAPASTTERRIEAAAMGGDTQMTRAFHEAYGEKGGNTGGNPGNRQARRQAARQHDQQHQQQNRGQQQQQPQAQQHQEPSHTAEQETAKS